jgi:hypothetical protein
MGLMFFSTNQLLCKLWFLRFWKLKTIEWLILSKYSSTCSDMIKKERKKTVNIPVPSLCYSDRCLNFYMVTCASQSMRKPKLFWVSAGAPLVSVILSTILVFAFKAQHHGISVVSFRSHANILPLHGRCCLSLDLSVIFRLVSCKKG